MHSYENFQVVWTSVVFTVRYTLLSKEGEWYYSEDHKT